jgi:hypothetical protein
MNNPDQSLSALDDLVIQLLACGGVLSQLIVGMVEFSASGRPTTTVPIPDVAHSLIRSVVPEMERRYSQTELATAAAMVKEVTQRICDEIVVVCPDMN